MLVANTGKPPSASTRSACVGCVSSPRSSTPTARSPSLPPCSAGLNATRPCDRSWTPFFTWARAEHNKRPERGLVATALGYCVRQEPALRRFLDDGRLRKENNYAERELRAVAVGRRAWLFYGSDDHACAAGNILSLVASCKLHALDPELYLAEIIRIVPYWLATGTSSSLRSTGAPLAHGSRPSEFQLPLGHITVPPTLPKELPSPD